MVFLDEEVICGTTASLLDVQPGFSLSREASEKVDGIMSSNPFQRPKRVFNLYVLNDAPDAESLYRFPNMGSRTYKIERDDASIVSAFLQFGMAKHREVEQEYLTCDLKGFCDEYCQEQSLVDLTHDSEFVYNPSDQPMRGSLVIHSDQSTITLELEDPSIRAWAMEIACMWHAVSSLGTAQTEQHETERLQKRVTLLHGALTRGALLRLGWESENDAVHATRAFEGHVVTDLARKLNSVYDGQVAIQVLKLGESRKAALLLNGNLKAVTGATRYSRELTPMWYGGALFGNNEELTASEWLAQAIMWVGGIILIVAACCGCCYMYHMPLQKDTLLYGKGKLD